MRLYCCPCGTGRSPIDPKYPNHQTHAYWTSDATATEAYPPTNKSHAPSTDQTSQSASCRRPRRAPTHHADTNPTQERKAPQACHCPRRPDDRSPTRPPYSYACPSSRTDCTGGTPERNRPNASQHPRTTSRHGPGNPSPTRSSCNDGHRPSHGRCTDGTPSYDQPTETR